MGEYIGRPVDSNVDYDKVYRPERDGLKVLPTPEISFMPILSPGKTGIKIATPDLIIQSEITPIDVLGQIYFENLAGHEIINIGRSTLINGRNVSYSLIGNLSELQRRYNPLNIFTLPETVDKYFKNFAIRLDVHVPEKGSGPNEERVWIALPKENEDDPPPEYLAFAEVGDIIIDVTNMEKNEVVDVQILNSGSLLSDTIYTEAS